MSKTFDPDLVSITVGGHIVSGYADGAFVTAERNSDAFTRLGGADGEQARFKSNDKSGLITITLMQSSLSNGIFQGFANADEVGNGGKVPILIKDGNGTEQVAAAQAWVKKVPSKGYAKENTDRQWVFETDSLLFIGGGIEDDVLPA